MEGDRLFHPACVTYLAQSCTTWSRTFSEKLAADGFSGRGGGIVSGTGWKNEGPPRLIVLQEDDVMWEEDVFS